MHVLIKQWWSAVLLIGLFSFAPLSLQAADIPIPPPTTAHLNAKDPSTLFTVTNGSITYDASGQAPVYRWHINAGQTSQLSLKPGSPWLYLMRDYEQFNLEFRIISGHLNDLGLESMGSVSGPRSYKLGHWDLGIFTTTNNVWHQRSANLSRPSWFPWDPPDGLGRQPLFYLTAMALEPDTVVELRGMVFQKQQIRVKTDFEMPTTWPILTRHEDGSATYVIKQYAQNIIGEPADIRVKLNELPKGYKVGIYAAGKQPSLKAMDTLASSGEAWPQSVDFAKVGPSKQLSFVIVAHMSAATMKKTPQLDRQTVGVTLSAPKTKDVAEVPWRMTLTRPLSEDIRRQVLLSPEDVAAVRQAWATKDQTVLKKLKADKIIEGADEMASKTFLTLPSGNHHVRNNYIGDWRVSDRMPEIVNLKTKKTQFNTDLAGITWKEYMAHRGQACSHLAQAYLYTGDEKYADAAAKLFTLYAQQYTRLSWANLNDAPWAVGVTTLSASRTDITSSYGSNWYFKGHCELLSAITGSKVWTPEFQKKVYLGFVVPYANELMKFPAPISNMSDITNRNVLLLGLAFDDANLVSWALYHPAGVLNRVKDINTEGFSSEGRTISYHLSGLTESIPTLAYAVRSGLKIKLPIQRLTAALVMPFQRAALTGTVPSYGDGGRGQRVTPTALADEVYELAPDQTILKDIGRGTSVHMILQGEHPARNAWKKHLETTPRLYPQTGFAILRTGDTPDTQIMATLDWGRSVFHSHLDRNQISLLALGKIFSQGVGSLYNVGSGGMVRTRDPKLDSFVGGGSLGHNVIMVDQQDQIPAAGKLLAWNGDPDFQLAISHIDAIAPGVGHTRALVLTHRVLVLLDRISSDKPHTYDFTYHNLGKLSLADGWQATAATQPLGDTANYQNLEDLQKLQGPAGTPVHMVWDLTHNVRPPRKGAKKAKAPELPVIKLDLWQLRAKGGSFYSAITGMNNLDNTRIPDSAPSLIQRTNDKTSFFATVLEPDHGDSTIRTISPAGDDGVTIQFKDGKTITLHLDELIQKYAVKP